MDEHAAATPAAVPAAKDAVAAAPAIPTAARRPTDDVASRRWVVGALAAGAVYLGVALLVWAHVWLTGSPSRSVTCPCGDVAEQLWWFEWLPRALQHGHNPLYTNALFARFGGINAMTNTSWLLPAAVLAPVTLLGGPILSSNVANLLAPVLTGLAAYALAGRFVRLWAARCVAGLAYGFSPFVLGNVDLGHLNLTLLAYPPLVLLVGDRLLRGELAPRRAGVYLGALTVAEAFIGIEVVLVTALLALACVLGVLVVRRDLLADAWPRLLEAGAVATVLTAVCLAYPVWVFFFGPQHVGGPYWPFLHGLRGPGAVWPQAGFASPSRAVRSAGYLGPSGPGTGYVGLGIVVVAAAGFALAARRARYAVVTIAALGCLCLEANFLGLWWRIPVVDDVVVVRYAIGTTLCLALLLAMAIDGSWRPERRATRALRARWGAWGSGACAVAVALVALVPVGVTYALPLTVETARVPAWFTTAGAAVPTGTAVLVLPFAWYTSDEAMAWQAESGLRIALVGGFGFIPGADHQKDEFLSRLPDARLLQRLSRGRALSHDQLARLRVLLARWAPLEVVAIDGRVAASAVATVRHALGAPGTHLDGATVWRLSRPGSSTLGRANLPRRHGRRGARS
ncbi:MAG TPA: hypothetical protein VGZ03_09960 [Acidimicrobiales bacterium]|nr:hypothetical protein [Acidimicrobiales bacterium]